MTTRNELSATLAAKLQEQDEKLTRSQQALENVMAQVAHSLLSSVPAVGGHP